jgi:hypothetical protein
MQPDPQNNAIGYALSLYPGTGEANLRRVLSSSESATMAAASGLAERFGSTAWTTVSIRADGPNLRVFLNDELILQGQDDAFGTGAAAIVLVRLGNPDDDAESAVVIRNLRIAGLTGSRTDRLPSIQQP